MPAIAVVLAVVAAIAASLARWTRVHPLAIAALGGVPGGLIAVLLPVGPPNRATWAFAVIVYVVTTIAAAFGGFIGWLRRHNLRRNG